jgi:NADH:ubiquinone oxidoreductase subunit 2 (subunit N)
MEGPGGVLQMQESQIIIPIVVILIIILSVVTVFLYKNRKIQIKFALAAIALSAALTALTAWFAYSAGEKYQAVLNPGVRTFLPLIILLFSILAFMGIRKDENLVRSYDRLR